VLALRAKERQQNCPPGPATVSHTNASLAHPLHTASIGRKRRICVLPARFRSLIPEHGWLFTLLAMTIGSREGRNEGTSDGFDMREIKWPASTIGLVMRLGMPGMSARSVRRDISSIPPEH
jgi:hypothetical protein